MLLRQLLETARTGALQPPDLLRGDVRHLPGRLASSLAEANPACVTAVRPSWTPASDRGSPLRFLCAFWRQSRRARAVVTTARVLDVSGRDLTELAVLRLRLLDEPLEGLVRGDA